MVERGSSGFQFNDYDNWNTNSNVSSHPMQRENNYRRPCLLAKNHDQKLKALVPQEKATL